MLYELLAGRPVRDTGEGRQLAALHELMTGVPYPPLPATVPHLVRDIVDRALSRDPAMRWGTAEELRRALEQAMLATGQTATAEDVANVLAHFSRERTAKRKDAIERAMRAATEGHLNAATLVAPLSARAMPGNDGSAPGAGGTRPGTPISAASGALVGSTGPFLPLPYPSAVETLQTGPSMRTLGAASMSSHPMPGSSAAKVFAGVLVLALVAVLGVVAGVLVTKRGQRPTAAAGTTSTVRGVASAELTGVPVSATTTDGVPAAGSEPSTPSTGLTTGDSSVAASSAHTARDGGAVTAAGSSRKPSTAKPSAKPGAKPGDGDEYGF